MCNVPRRERRKLLENVMSESIVQQELCAGYVQSSHPGDFVMNTLVYSRMATQQVLTHRQTAWVRMFSGCSGCWLDSTVATMLAKWYFAQCREGSRCCSSGSDRRI